MNGRQVLRRCFRDRLLTVGTLICVLLIFCTSFLTDSYETNAAYQRKTAYGFHNGAAMHISSGSEERLKNHLSVNESGEMLIYGTVLYEEEKEAGYIGSVDDGFKELEQLTFLEGGYPQNTDEIALESCILDILNLTYTIGEEITLTVRNGNEEVREYTYVLCGILDNYSADWYTDGYPVCSGITYDFDGPLIDRDLFFIGDYDNPNQMQELNELLGDISGSRIVYNELSYPLTSLEMMTFIQNGGALCAVMIVCALFMFCLEISSSGKQIYRNKVILSLGIEEKELRKRIYGQALLQCVCAWLVMAVICTIASVAVMSVSKASYAFSLTFHPYLISLFMTVMIVILSKTLQIHIMNKGRTVPSGKDLTKYEAKKIKRKRKGKLDSSSFAQLNRDRTDHYFILEKIMFVISMCVMVVSLSSVSYQWRYYRIISEEYTTDYSWNSNLYSRGLDEKQIQRVENTTGIGKVEYFHSAFYKWNEQYRINLRYEGMEEDSWYSLYEDIGRDDGTAGIDVTVVSIPEESSIWNMLPDTVSSDMIQGNHVVCSMPLFYEGDNGEPVMTTDKYAGNTGAQKAGIHEGDVLELCVGDESYEAVCDMVFSDYDADKTMVNFSSMTVFVSNQMFETLFGETKGVYNNVSASLEDDLNAEAVDQLMGMVSTDSLVQYQNERSFQERFRNIAIRQSVFLGALCTVLCLGTLWLSWKNRTDLFRNEKNRWRLYRSLGCSCADIMDMYRIPDIWGCFVTVITANLILLPIWLYRLRGLITLSAIPDQTSYFLSLLKQQTVLSILVIPQLVFIVCYCLLQVLMEKKMKKKIMENF